MINQFRIVEKETGKFVEGFSAVPIEIDSNNFRMNESALEAHKDATEYLAAVSQKDPDKYTLQGRKVEVTPWQKIH